jgi:hypothetical protein
VMPAWRVVESGWAMHTGPEAGATRCDALQAIIGHRQHLHWLDQKELSLPGVLG